MEEIEQARKVIDIVSVQNEYNIGNRKSEAVLEYCERERHCVYSVVSGGGGQAGATGRQAGRVCEEAWRDRVAAFAGVAAAPLAGDAADSGDVFGGASGGELEGRDLTLSDAEWQELEAAAK